jgi:hypothetical protein
VAMYQSQPVRCMSARKETTAACHTGILADSFFGSPTHFAVQIVMDGEIFKRQSAASPSKPWTRKPRCNPKAASAPANCALALSSFVRREPLELGDPDRPLGKDSPNLQLSAHSGNTPS